MTLRDDDNACIVTQHMIHFGRILGVDMRIVGCYLVTFVNRTHVFDWCVVR